MVNFRSKVVCGLSYHFFDEEKLPKGGDGGGGDGPNQAWSCIRLRWPKEEEIKLCREEQGQKSFRPRSFWPKQVVLSLGRSC